MITKLHKDMKITGKLEKKLLVNKSIKVDVVDR